MPGCCRGASCSCRITVGPGIAVTGSGSPADPFVISSNLDLSVYDTIVARQNAITTALAGSGRKTIVITTNAYVALPNDFVRADATAAGFWITLPVTPPLGTEVAVKRVDSSANMVTVSAGGATIDGDATATLPDQFSGGTFIFDGANWLILGGS